MKTNFRHINNDTPPANVYQPKLIPVVLKLKDTYNFWQNIFEIFPKSKRYTFGSKIDEIFLNTIEYCLLASYANYNDKLTLLNKGVMRLDLLKLFFQLAFETKCINTKKYIAVSKELFDIGKMLGGWKKSIEQKTPDGKSREKN